MAEEEAIFKTMISLKKNGKTPGPENILDKFCKVSEEIC